MYSRRQFISRAPQALLLCNFLVRAINAEAVPSGKVLSLSRFRDELLAVSEKLQAGLVTAEEWYAQVLRQYGSAPITELWNYLDVDRILSEVEFGAEGEKFVLAPLFPTELGGPVKEVQREMINKIAVVEKGASIPPHGHENMVSAFLVLRGRARVRQYHKISTTETSLIIRPALDSIQKVGATSAITDFRTNCHWLEALEDDLVIFSTKFVEVQNAEKVRGRIHCDVYAAAELESGLLEAPIISSAEAHTIYR